MCPLMVEVAVELPVLLLVVALDLLCRETISNTRVREHYCRVRVK